MVHPSGKNRSDGVASCFQIEERPVVPKRQVEPRNPMDKAVDSPQLVLKGGKGSHHYQRSAIFDEPEPVQSRPKTRGLRNHTDPFDNTRQEQPARPQFKTVAPAPAEPTHNTGKRRIQHAPVQNDRQTGRRTQPPSSNSENAKRPSFMQTNYVHDESADASAAASPCARRARKHSPTPFEKADLVLQQEEEKRLQAAAAPRAKIPTLVGVMAPMQPRPAKPYAYNPPWKTEDECADPPPPPAPKRQDPKPWEKACQVEATSERFETRPKKSASGTPWHTNTPRGEARVQAHVQVPWHTGTPRDE